MSRVGLLARENSPVRMEFNALGVRLSSSSPDLGGAVEVVEAEYTGEDVTVAFNPGLPDRRPQRVATGEKAKIEVRDGLKPALVRGETEGFLYLVMPVRLPEPVRTGLRAARRRVRLAWAELRDFRNHTRDAGGAARRG